MLAKFLTATGKGWLYAANNRDKAVEHLVKEFPNLNAKDELIPIASNPDGSWGTFRIPPERTWSVNNTLSF